MNAQTPAQAHFQLHAQTAMRPLAQCLRPVQCWYYDPTAMGWCRVIDLDALDAVTTLLKPVKAVRRKDLRRHERMQIVRGGDVLFGRQYTDGRPVVALVPPQFDGYSAIYGFVVFRPDPTLLDR